MTKKSYDGEVVHDPYYGAMDGVSETDWQFGADSIVLPKARLGYHDTKIEYNQNDVNAYSCTVFAAMGALSDLAGYRFTLEEQKEVFDLAVKEGLDPTFGWYGHKAVDLVRRWWNAKFPEGQIISQHVSINKEVEALTPLDMGYSLTVGLKITKAMMDDYKDGKLDKIHVDNALFGHFVRLVKDKDDAYKLIVDNYKGKKNYSNKYILTYAQIKEMITLGVFFVNAYFYMYKEDYKVAQEMGNISPYAIASVEKAKKVGITDWSRPKKIVADHEAELMLIKAGVFTQELGGVSKERMAVAMDRAGLFNKTK